MAKQNVNAPTATKVGNKPAAKPAAQEADEKVVRERVDFLTVVDKSLLDAEGRLTVVPEGFDYAKHKPPGKDEFASEGLYMRFRAADLQKRGTAMVKRSQELIKQAEHIEKYGDPKKRQAIKRFERAAAEIAKLRQLAKDEGIDLAELGIDLNMEADEDAAS